ncbi:hypothetical protein HYV81_01095 [Candidatus Woesearchaeota archaeon]|nr:hypothetical protein [Candidatus Woesearchaeota archaeon]
MGPDILLELADPGKGPIMRITIEDLAMRAILSQDEAERASANARLASIFLAYKGVMKDGEKIFMVFEACGDVRRGYVCHIPK